MSYFISILCYIPPPPHPANQHRWAIHRQSYQTELRPGVLNDLVNKSLETIQGPNTCRPIY